MITVVGVQFKGAGKEYWFDPGELMPQIGQGVIVETSRGVEYGEVTGELRQVEESVIVQPLRQVVRIAGEEDEQRLVENKKKEKEAFSIAQEKIVKHGLEMKLVDVEYAFDSSRIHFFFTANGRVDFRELVRDLAAQFRTRIELRQIGVRDEAKMLGGLGPCGRPICCRQFLPDFQPVSIRMAKEQNLSLNPAKISGQCGRLMCCLKYEQDVYECARKSVPKLGRDVVTPDGIGVVMDINVLKERMRVRLQMEDGSYDVREYDFCEVCRRGGALNERQEDDSEENLDEEGLELVRDDIGDERPARPYKQSGNARKPERQEENPRPRRENRPFQENGRVGERQDRPYNRNDSNSPANVERQAWNPRQPSAQAGNREVERPRPSRAQDRPLQSDAKPTATIDDANAEQRARPPRRRPNYPKRPREPRETQE